MAGKTNLFQQFLDLFPEIELPITLNNEIHHTFSQQNDVIPQNIIQRLLVSLGESEIDPFTEYIACFRIPDTHDFQAVVFWRADLLNYTYYLTTFSNIGQLIDCKPIAGLEVLENDILLQRIATIEEDWTIQIVEGEAKADSLEYNPASSQIIDMELLSEGDIIFSLRDDQI